MNIQIEKMLELQTLDLKIRTMNTRVATIPLEINKISEEIENEKKRYSTQKETLMLEELDIKNVEASIKEKDDQIRKLQGQSSMLRKNEEYRALMNEIESVRKGISELETKQLILMEKIQDNKAKVKDIDIKLKAKEKQTDEEIKDMNEIKAKIDNEITKIKTEREKYASTIEKSALLLYERLLSKGIGTPVAEVKENICSNCHLKLTPHTNNQAKKDIITQCDNCSHIIYYA
jgi:predicted  nucleic acid-binding Zn-ribbon protein